ncbi:MAG: zf-TFIIB domain-containing protein [Proteobacteria bacterium]|nr:zf-TFIIB domain-containing protein [Pseudomonadota bacterium]
MPKPPRPESSYFERDDLRKRHKIAELRRKQMAKEEAERHRLLHWRRCGNCGMELEEISFKGQTIHKCFNCGSVLLLRGTLESLCGKEKRILEAFLDIFKF